MIEEELEGQVYKKIGRLYEDLYSLGVNVPENYESNLPSVKSTIENSATRGYAGGYNPVENTIYIKDKKLGDTITEEDLEDTITEEAMHFLDIFSQGRVGSYLGDIYEYEYIYEYVGSAGILLEGINRDVGISERELENNLRIIKEKKEKSYDELKNIEIEMDKYVTYKIKYEDIRDFLYDAIVKEKEIFHKELVEDYENNNIFKKYLKEDYQPIKEIIEVPKDKRSDEDKQKLEDFLHTYNDLREYCEKKQSDLKKLSNETKNLIHLYDTRRKSKIQHYKGYNLAQKVYEKGWLEEFLNKNPNLLSKSCKKKKTDTENFLKQKGHKNIESFLKE